jgi:hypothetical protein
MDEKPKNKKKEPAKIPLERRLLWARWDKIVNMTSSEIRAFRQSDESQGIGWSKEQAAKDSISGMSGRDASIRIEAMINKASKYRNQYRTMPDWTDDEWRIANRQVSYISRARSNIGDLLDDEDNRTPKAKAMMIWGRDEIRSRGIFPDKEKLKEILMKDSVEYSQNSLLDILFGEE